MIILLYIAAMSFLLMVLFSICYVGLIPHRKLANWYVIPMTANGVLVTLLAIGVCK